jgi:hypothetical protein
LAGSDSCYPAYRGAEREIWFYSSQIWGDRSGSSCKIRFLCLFYSRGSLSSDLKPSPVIDPFAPVDFIPAYFLIRFWRLQIATTGLLSKLRFPFFSWNNLRLGGGNKATIERFFGEKA